MEIMYKNAWHQEELLPQICALGKTATRKAEY